MSGRAVHALQRLEQLQVFGTSLLGGRGERCEQVAIDLTGSRDMAELMQADLWSAGARVVHLKRTANSKTHKTIASEVVAA